MFKLLGGLLIPCAWLGGFAFLAYSFIFWGVLGIVHGATATPVDETAIVWGVIWLFLSKIVAAAIIWGGMILGVAMLGSSVLKTARTPRTRKSFPKQ